MNCWNQIRGVQETVFINPQKLRGSFCPLNQFYEVVSQLAKLFYHFKKISFMDNVGKTMP